MNDSANDIHSQRFIIIPRIELQGIQVVPSDASARSRESRVCLGMSIRLVGQSAPAVSEQPRGPFSWQTSVYSAGSLDSRQLLSAALTPKPWLSRCLTVVQPPT